MLKVVLHGCGWIIYIFEIISANVCSHGNVSRLSLTFKIPRDRPQISLKTISNGQAMMQIRSDEKTVSTENRTGRVNRFH